MATTESITAFLQLSEEIARVDKMLKPLKARLAGLEDAILREMEARDVDEVHCEGGDVIQRYQTKRTPVLNKAHVLTGVAKVLGAEVAAAALAGALARRSTVKSFNLKPGKGGAS